MQMNLNMWGKGIKETISKHDKHEMVSLLFIHKKTPQKNKMKKTRKKIEKHSEITDIHQAAHFPTQCYLTL